MTIFTSKMIILVHEALNNQLKHGTKIQIMLKKKQFGFYLKSIGNSISKL